MQLEPAPVVATQCLLASALVPVAHGVVSGGASSGREVNTDAWLLAGAFGWLGWRSQRRATMGVAYSVWSDASGAKASSGVVSGAG